MNIVFHCLSEIRLFILESSLSYKYDLSWIFLNQNLNYRWFKDNAEHS